MNFLSELKYFACRLYEQPTEIASLATILEWMVSLEVLNIENCCDRFTWSYVSLNSLFTNIADLPLLASLNILALNEKTRNHFEVLWELLCKLLTAEVMIVTSAFSWTVLTSLQMSRIMTVFCTTYNLCKKCKDICLDNKPAVIKCTSLED